jgi:hypothetical protein
MTHSIASSAASRFDKRHGWILVFILLAFGVTNYFVTDSLRIASGTVLGPFIGAFARDWQSCCTAFSWTLAPWAGAALMVAVVAQMWPRAGTTTPLWRYVVWGLGWAAWCFTGWVSFLHALE